MPATLRRVRRGFTLMELLVVIGIIAVLAAIVLVAGGRVLASGKKNATRDVLVMLDAALEAYITEKGELPSVWVYTHVEEPEASAPGAPPPPPPDAILLADARDPSETEALNPPNAGMINSGGLFFLVASQVPSAKAQVEGIPQRFVALWPIIQRRTTPPRSIATPVDAWGNPIRFVLPAVDGPIGRTNGVIDLNEPEQASLLPQRRKMVAVDGPEIVCKPSLVRRNNVALRPHGPDSDGGVCLGNRPYFYSAGEDGDPSTIEDNVYTTVPTITRN